MAVDRTTYTTRWRVRTYELDVNGHVNNAVYLNYAEQAATEHAEATGFGRAWALAHGGMWVVRRHEVTYHRPAGYDDELALTTRIVRFRGARGLRHTTIVRLPDDLLLVELDTEWVWARLADGRPARVPDEMTSFFTADA
jgi:acyl-CoA thioester hydrolase